MLRRAITVLSLLQLSASTRSTAADIDGLPLVIRATAIANYLHQLDCAAQVPIACASRDYGTLWSTRFLRTTSDSIALRNWQRLRDRYAATVFIDSAGSPAGAHRRVAVQLEDKVRIAGLQASTLDDFLQRLDLLVLPVDRPAWREAARYFWPAFQSW